MFYVLLRLLKVVEFMNPVILYMLKCFSEAYNIDSSVRKSDKFSKYFVKKFNFMLNFSFYNA